MPGRRDKAWEAVHRGTSRGVKFYAVAKGRRSGVYEDYEEAKEQIHKFSGAKWKAFDRYEEAIQFVDAQTKMQSFEDYDSEGYDIGVESAPAAKRMEGITDGHDPSLIEMKRFVAMNPNLRKWIRHDGMRYCLQFDGGSRGNPGVGGAGAVIYDLETNEMVCYAGHFIGENVTNNMAEYNGLILGLKMASSVYIDRLVIQGDSLLVLKQVQDEYQVKAPNLLALHEESQELISDMEVQVQHIARAQNAMADQLANHAMDTCDCFAMQF